MDPSNQLHLGCQLSNPRNNSANNPRKRKWVHEDPEEPSKKRRKTVSLTVEDTKPVKKGLKRKREDSEERKDVKRIKLSSSQQTAEDSKTDSKDSKTDSKTDSKDSKTDSKDSKTDSKDSETDSKTDSKETSTKTSCSSDDDCEPMDCPALNQYEGTDDGLVTISSDRQSRAVFNYMYKQEKKIGQGGFGFVFAGFRKSDHLPVALKWTQFQDLAFTVVSEHGKETLVPQEVALLLALKDVPAVVTLLDWYQLDSEVVLILERPEKCLNLSEFITSLGGLKEHLVKIIIQQLVDAFAEIHLRGVFHSDIKLENILIDHSPSVTRFRVIDFGCGSFLTPGDNKEPVTVAQIGEVLSKLLKASLDNGWEITKDCQDFLAACLWKKAKTRPSLYELKSHSWLNTLNPTNSESFQ